MNDDEPTGCLRSVLTVALLSAIVIVVLAALFWLTSAPTSA